MPIPTKNRTPADAAAVSPPPPAGTKTALVLALLGRAEGATLSELVAATGWQRHSTRAALSGLRKNGHAVSRGVRDGRSSYTLDGAK